MQWVPNWRRERRGFHQAVMAEILQTRSKAWRRAANQSITSTEKTVVVRLPKSEEGNTSTTPTLKENMAFRLSTGQLQHPSQLRILGSEQSPALVSLKSMLVYLGFSTQRKYPPAESKTQGFQTKIYNTENSSLAEPFPPFLFIYLSSKLFKFWLVNVWCNIGFKRI